VAAGSGELIYVENVIVGLIYPTNTLFKDPVPVVQ